MNNQMPIEYSIAPRARAALKGQWPVAMPMGFVTGILYTILQIVMNLSLTPSMEKMTVLIEQGYPLEYVLQWAQESMLPMIVPMGILWLASIMLTPALSMGMHAYSLKLLRGQQGQFADLFSRMKIFCKTICLSFMVNLRVFLWMLLGMAAYAAVVFALTYTGSAELMMTLVPALATLAVLPGVIAMFRYMMADYAMADEPTMGVNAAIRLSKQMMKKRKLRLLSLLVGWTLVNQLGGSLLQMFFGSILGMALGMLLSLACSVYIEVLKASFFLTYHEHDAGKAPDHTSAPEEQLV